MLDLSNTLVETFFGETFANATGSTLLAMQVMSHVILWLCFILLVNILVGLTRAIAKPFLR